LVPPFYQTPTFDPASIATVTKAPAAQCLAVNRDLKPVLPDQGKQEAFGYVFNEFHLQKDILGALNQGASLPEIQKALTSVTGGGKPLGLSPRDLYKQDLTGDGVPEVVFYNRAYRYSIFSCQGGRYILALDIPSDDLFTIEQLSVEDLNRDKLPEIVVGITDSAAVLWPTYVYIFRWNGGAFQDLSLSKPGNEVHLLRGFKFFEFTGSGWYEQYLRQNRLT
jgi:hypothetical protein